MGIQQTKRHLRITLQTTPYGRRNRLPGLPAQARLGVQFDDEATHGAHLVETWRDVHADAEVFVQPRLQTVEVFQVCEVFQAFEQALFLLAREQEDALRGWRVLGQVFAAAVTSARWARLA